LIRQRCGDMALSITWLKFSLACKKCWAWMKKNWQLLVGMAIPVILTVVFRKKINLSKILTRINQDHQQELDLIAASRDEELRQIRLADKKYLKAVEQIEEQYGKDLEAVGLEEREKIQEILHESGQDVDKLTKMLADRFKFRIIDGGKS
jgi:hypothetical protein